MNYLKIYNMEAYLFESVSSTYQTSGKLSAFDFFCIVIWKANRAKSKIAKRLIDKDKSAGKDLNAIVEELTAQIYSAKDNSERMGILFKWGFRLPMASAILTVLYPHDFTVYDIRACDMLQGYHELQNKIRFDEIWIGYEKFVEAVKNSAPAELSLRDKDCYLWGKSFAKDLNEDILRCFQKEKGIRRDESKVQKPVRENQQLNNITKISSIADSIRAICEELGAGGKTILRKDILEKAKQLGINELSILPADYCDNTKTGKWSRHSFLHSVGSGKYVLQVLNKAGVSRFSSKLGRA